jgi:hypothetical protein
MTNLGFQYNFDVEYGIYSQALNPNPFALKNRFALINILKYVSRKTNKNIKSLYIEKKCDHITVCLVYWCLQGRIYVFVIGTHLN